MSDKDRLWTRQELRDAALSLRKVIDGNINPKHNSPYGECEIMTYGLAEEGLEFAADLIEQLEAENERLRETLEWYGVRAASLDNERIMEAVFTELTLDGGTRAGKALEGTDETA